MATKTVLLVLDLLGDFVSHPVFLRWRVQATGGVAKFLKMPYVGKKASNRKNVELLCNFAGS